MPLFATRAQEADKAHWALRVATRPTALGISPRKCKSGLGKRRRFGGECVRSPGIANPYTFTGRRLDDETGLFYYRNRYYHAQLGRFVSRDPIEYGDGMSLYEYAGTNPQKYVDPSGLAIKKIRCHHRIGNNVDYKDVYIQVPPQTTGTGCPGNWSFLEELGLTDDEKRLEQICRDTPKCDEADLARLFNGVERFENNFTLVGTNTCSRWAGGCTSLLLDELNGASIGVGMEIWDYSGWLSKVWVPYLLPDGLSTYHAVVCVTIGGKKVCYFDNGGIGEGIILKGDHLFFWDDIDLDVFGPGYKPCP